MTPSKHEFFRQMIPMCIIAVVGWAIFLAIYRLGWPGSFTPETPTTTFWLWLLVGTSGFLVTVAATLRLFKTPAQWRSSAAIALVAPAMCLDMVATVFFESWFPNPGSADDRFYPALILGSVGITLLICLFLTQPTSQKLSTQG